MEAQVRFLQQVRQLAKGVFSFADELAEVLQVSPDSVYRRLRGETALTVDELLKICRHYHLSPDVLTQTESGVVNFQYQLLQSQEDFFQYFCSFRDQLRQLAKAGKQAQVIYAADDVPIFHHFQFPEHAAFKMYFWMKSVLNIQSLAGKKFTPDMLPAPLLAVGREVYDLYCQVPSIEIWTEESANSTLNQILYCWESGLFEHHRDAAKIVEQTHQLVEQVEQQAEVSSKLSGARNGGDFSMYHAEIQIGNNIVLVKAGPQQMVYIRHQTFNTLKSTNPTFCAETEQWLQNEIRKSLPISGVAEKQRYQFFQKIKQKIDRLAAKLH
jgi:transcriptional regulator with XRE-family HTH domain